MEQIVRKDGRIYYGDWLCSDADGAYRLFRSDYNASCGRSAFRFLNRLGQRSERIHGYGFDYGPGTVPVPCGNQKRTPVRILGLVGSSYCRTVGLWDIPFDTEEEIERWLDWAFSRGSGALRTVGVNDKSGRTSKRLKTRYR